MVYYETFSILDSYVKTEIFSNFYINGYFIEKSLISNIFSKLFKLPVFSRILLYN